MTENTEVTLISLGWSHFFQQQLEHLVAEQLAQVLNMRRSLRTGKNALFRMFAARIANRGVARR